MLNQVVGNRTESSLSKWPTSFPSVADSEDMISYSSERKVKNSNVSSQRFSHLNPNVKEFVPRLCSKRPGTSDEAQTEESESENLQRKQVRPEASESQTCEDQQKQEGKSSSEEKLLDPPTFSSKHTSLEANKSDTSQGQQKGEERLNSVAKLSVKAPFLFQLPPKPLLLRQQLGDVPTKATRDIETQTESLSGLSSEKMCATCQRQRLEQQSKVGSTEGQASAVTVRTVSREHKIKYVVCQAGMIMQESPDCLSQDSELRMRLKAKLQAMCLQFGSRVTAKSELEDATICRIAVDLLKEHPVFSQPDKRISFLRHLSAETDVQLEIAHELMAEEPLKEDRSGIDLGMNMRNFKLNNQEGVFMTKSLLTTQSDASPSKNVDNLVPSSQHSTSLKPSLLATTPADGGGNSVSADGQEGDREIAVAENRAGMNFAKHDAGIEKLLEEMTKHMNLAGGAATLPPVAGNLLGLDLQHCQEVTQVLKKQQLYLQSLLASNAGAKRPETLVPEKNPFLNQMLALSGQPSLLNIEQTLHGKEEQQSNLTVANLVKHNSLISERDKAQAHTASGSDVSNDVLSAFGSHHHSSIVDAFKNSDPIKRVPKIGSLRKLPPLDLRVAKRATNSLSQPLKQEKRTPDSSDISGTQSSRSSFDPLTPAQPSLSDHQLPGGLMSKSFGDVQFSAPTVASFLPSNTSALTSARQPNLSTLCAVSKLRKYMTPLQRKRLKMMGEPTVVAESQAQNIMPDQFVGETCKPGTKLVQQHPESQAVVLVANDPKEKSTGPLSFEHRSFVVQPSFQGDSILSSKQLTDSFPKSIHISQPTIPNHLAPSSTNMATKLSEPLPNTFPFLSSFTGSQSKAASSKPARLESSGQPTPTFPDMNKMAPIFDNESMPSALFTKTRSSLGSQEQINSSSHPTERSNIAAFSVKAADLNQDVPSLVKGLASEDHHKVPKNPSNFSEIPESGYKCNIFSGFSLYNEHVDAPSINGHFSLDREPTHPDKKVDNLTVSFTEDPHKLANGSTNGVQCFDNTAFISDQHKPSSHAMDDLDAIDDGGDDDDNICEYSSDTLDSASEAHRNKENDEMQSVLDTDTNCGSDSDMVLDVDILVKKKMEQSMMADSKGDCGLEEISLTGSRMATSNASEITRKKETKSVNPDNRWQTVSNPKKSSKKSKVAENLNVLKFRTQEKYTNLVALILDVYKQLEREEAKEVLETVFTSTNQMSGLRQGQILAEVDLVVTEWYPERVHKPTNIANGEDSSTGFPCETDSKNESATADSENGSQNQERQRSWSKEFVGSAIDGTLGEKNEQTKLSGSDEVSSSSWQHQQVVSIDEDCQLQ